MRKRSTSRSPSRVARPPIQAQPPQPINVSLGRVLNSMLGRDDFADSPEVRAAFPFDPRLVPQTRDLFQLFDTTPDLSGADVDVGPFIRDGEDLDVLVFWRDDASGLGTGQMWKSGPRAGCPFKKLLPARHELCPVAAWRFRRFFSALKLDAKDRMWVRDWRKGWIKLADPDRIYPGQLVLLHKDVGGYDPRVGWTGDAASTPEPCWVAEVPQSPEGPEEPVASGDSALEDEENAVAAWQSVHQHSIDVARELDAILSDGAIAAALATADLRQPLSYVPPWHDVGKAHAKFTAKLKAEARNEWNELRKGDHPAKAPRSAWKSFFRDEEDAAEADGAFVRRRGFRHELASALALLETLRLACPKHAALALPEELRKTLDVTSDATGMNHDTARLALGPIADLNRLSFNLLLYLVACHHGKVRLGLRSTEGDYDPGQRDPVPEADTEKPLRRCQGVQDGDVVPACRVSRAEAATDPDSAITTPAVTLSLDPMELCSARYGSSWADRMRELVDIFGPFCLGYLEALIRAADQRASAAVHTSSISPADQREA